MKIIGITGRSGSGKSTAAELILSNYNACSINADNIAKELSNDISSEYYASIINLFGKDILLKDNKLDRKKIANIIYNNENYREKLNNLTFKYVKNEINNRINYIKENNYDFIILDVPLLFEAKIESICDIILAIIADEKNLIKRIESRDHTTQEIAKERINIQKCDNFLKSHSDFVIYNNGNINDLKFSLKEIFDNI